MTASTIARPRVPVSGFVYTTTGSQAYFAECRHCDWTARSTIRASVDEQARWHREQHRRGELEVTR